MPWNVELHDDFVPEFLTLTMQVLTNDEPKVKSLRIHLMEVVINAIYYNPALALHVLETIFSGEECFMGAQKDIDSNRHDSLRRMCLESDSPVWTSHNQLLLQPS